MTVSELLGAFLFLVVVGGTRFVRKCDGKMNWNILTLERKNTLSGTE